MYRMDVSLASGHLQRRVVDLKGKEEEQRHVRVVRGDERTVLWFFAKYERKVVGTGHVIRDRLNV